MSRPFWRISVRSEFSAGHALRHYNGKCENMHGHNFFVEVTLEGEKLTEDTQFLVDFTVVKKHLKAILETLDHKDLNVTSPFDTLNPTSENLAQYIFKEMGRCLVEYPHVRVYSATVSEKSAQAATYYEG